MNQASTGPVFGRRETPPGAGETARPFLSYDGKAGSLLGLGLAIALWSLVTAGFYRFWGKTRVRRYLASRISVLGDRFEYTGTGKELFLGFLIALAALIPLGAASYGIEIFTAGRSAAVQVFTQALQYAVVLYLIGYATFRARRYRLSRTVLRGIRFWQTGSNVGYGLRMLGYLALTAATLGIARPLSDVGLHRYMMENTWFGSQKFAFDGRAGEMMGKWVLSLLLVPFTLGISLMWYTAFKMRYLYGRTRYQGVGFHLPISLGDLLRIYTPYALGTGILFLIFYVAFFLTIVPMILVNPPADPQVWIQTQATSIYGAGVAAAFVVFGLLAPVLKLVLLTHRFVGLLSEQLQMVGNVDLQTILQSAAAQPRSGEGLADALDIGGGLEIGF